MFGLLKTVYNVTQNDINPQLLELAVAIFVHERSCKNIQLCFSILQDPLCGRSLLSWLTSLCVQSLQLNIEQNLITLLDFIFSIFTLFAGSTLLATYNNCVLNVDIVNMLISSMKYNNAYIAQLSVKAIASMCIVKDFNELLLKCGVPEILGNAIIDKTNDQQTKQQCASALSNLKQNSEDTATVQTVLNTLGINLDKFS